MRSTSRATSETESPEDESDNGKRITHEYERLMQTKKDVTIALQKWKLIITLRIQTNRLHCAQAVIAFDEGIRKIASNKNASLKG